ncbi:MAG: hypothetical protein JXR37_33110 [Kiritimatiellae bacterium]|nr:hypothetical protein [Kiritimatiellia bacterium]
MSAEPDIARNLAGRMWAGNATVRRRRALLLVSFLAATAAAGIELKTGVRNLPGPLPAIEHRVPGVEYHINLRSEMFFLVVPRSYDGSEPYGIVAYIDADDAGIIPAGWDRKLEARRLLFIAPQQAGDRQPAARRAGLTVTAVYKLIELLNIDRKRVYVAGLSGGGRVATMLAFRHHDVFTAAIPIGGVDYFRSVKEAGPQGQAGPGGFELGQDTQHKARERVRFVLITGSEDPGRAETADIYRRGFTVDKFKAELIEVPGMGRRACTGTTLEQALAFIEPDVEPGAAPRRPRPATPRTLKAETRTWTLASGWQFDAQLVKIEDESVLVKKDDGKTYRVKLAGLSEADQTYVKEMAAGE